MANRDSLIIHQKHKAIKAQQAKRAMALVEVLVVIGIIALLIAILLPTATKAREASNRVVCGANLHNMGASAINFANDHRGVFPPCYVMPGVSYPFRFPVLISRNDSLYNGTNTAWKTKGLPLSVWDRYGMPLAAWRCPSADYAEVRTYDDPGGNPDSWGDVAWTHYMYVAGLTTANKGKSVNNWGKVPPAVKLNHRQGVLRILAADMVYYSGGPGTKWDAVRPRYMINHRKTGRQSTIPAFQNILYADGHVDGKGTDYYASSLDTNRNYSLLHSGRGVGGYFYWGPAQTDKALAAPLPPTPPSTGGKTPPSPPSKPPTPPILPTPF